MKLIDPSFSVMGLPQVYTQIQEKKCKESTFEKELQLFIEISQPYTIPVAVIALIFDVLSVEF